jgi:hypothetical protein
MSNAIIWHHHNKTPGLTEASYNALLETALDVGAKDMTEPVAIPAAPAAPARPTAAGVVPPPPPGDVSAETE